MVVISKSLFFFFFFWSENFLKKVSDRKSRRSRYFSTGRSRTTRRFRIFQRNHLLDFENFLKKVSDSKTPGVGIFYCNRLLREEVTLRWKKRPVEGLSRPAGRRRCADSGFPAVITSETLSNLQNISKSVVERDPPIGVSLDRRVEKDPRTTVSLVALSREPSADEGFPTVMTSWTLNIFQSPQYEETRP